MKSRRKEKTCEAPHRPDAPELFRRALMELGRPVPRSGPAHYATRAGRLRESVGLLVDAFLVAQGRAPGDGQRLVLLNRYSVLDPASTGPLAEILVLDTDGEWNHSRIEKLDVLERQYRALLPDLRSALTRVIPGYQGIPGLWRRAAGNAALRWTLGVAAGAAMLLLLAYHLARPQYVLDLGGQVFWTESSTRTFSQARSKRFNVHVDGVSHRYNVALGGPVRVGRLRIDPVDKAYPTEVDILHLRLIGAGGAESPDVAAEPGSSWSCINCRWLSRNKQDWRLRPLNDDPHIVGPPRPPSRTVRVDITMRVLAKKTFWEWLTRLKKTH